MKLVVAVLALVLTVVAGQSTVTIANGTTGAWTDAGLWTGSVVPATSMDITVAGGGQLNVATAVTTLNLGLTASSFLNVQSTGSVTVAGTVNWASGNVAIATGGAFAVTGSVAVKAGASMAQELRGPGTLTVNQGQVTVEDSANLIVTAAANIAASNGVSIGAGSGVRVTGATTRLPTPIQLTAASSNLVVAGDATVSLNAATTFSGPGETFVDGTISLTGAGAVTVAPGNKFNVRGGILSFIGGSSTFHMTVGDGTTAAYLNFVSSTFVAGMQGSYQITANSEVRIKPGATVRTQIGTTQLNGAGKMFLEAGATLRAEGSTTINLPITNAGSISFYAGQQINIKDVTQTSDQSRVSFEALQSGFVVVNAGHVSLNGNVEVKLGTYQPTTKVAIMQCTLITGRFQRQQITRNNGQAAKGAVQIEGYFLYYDPQGDPNNPIVDPAAGSIVTPSIMVAVLSILAALFGRQL